jgi:hypothetical protein
VKYLALIQDGHEDRRPLDNLLGAWVIRAEKPGQFAVAALDENGTTLAEVELTRISMQLLRPRHCSIDRSGVEQAFHP